MEILKKGWAKKLIIILVALMIFNVVVPNEAQAWDLAGILFKPITAMITTQLVSLDVSISLLLNGGLSLSFGLIKTIVDECTKPAGERGQSTDEFLSKVFIGPDTIFAGRVKLFNANIFNVNEFDREENDYSGLGLGLTVLTDETAPGSILMTKVKGAIASIYVRLRDICALIMLAGLIFTGIRILVNSHSPQKRRTYLMLVQDWLVGMILLIFSHIIMIGIFYISDTLVDALASSLFGFGGLNANLIAQSLASMDSAEWIICTIMLGYMIYLTVVFAIAYFKRFVWLCVLIVFAPVVSVMYAFGQQTKQIYSNWLREYITTVFIQPFHVVVYFVLVSIPLDMVNSTGGFDNGISNLFEVVYALGAMSFIRPAEMYMRQLFGMDKGLARMASFDSGKQTLDDVKQKAQAVVGIGVKTAKAIGTGGLSVPGDLEGAKEDIDKLKENPVTEDALEAHKDTKSEQLNSNVAAIADLSADERLQGAKLLGEVARGEKSEDSLNDGEKSLLERYRMFQASKNAPPATPPASEDAAAPEKEKDLGQEATTEPATEENKPVEKPKRNIKGPLSILKTLHAVGKGDMGIIDAVSGMIPTSLKERYKPLMGGLEKPARFLREFDAQGGIRELYKGFNQVRSGFYATGAPNDWQNSAKRMDERAQERLEQRKYNFVNNEGNREFFMNIYRKEFRAQYPDTNKYSDAYIENLALQKAESKLKSLADTYVPLGVTDASTAKSLEDDRKHYGYTAEEAIYQRANFNKFDSSPQNTSPINATYHVNVSKVSDAIPNAREYYHNGYTSIDAMQKVDALQRTLNTSLETAMKFDEALKKGEKLVYKGTNDSVRKIFDNINKNYNK